MRHNLQYLAAAAVIMAAAFASCKGRRADATPNGETVEVNVVVPENVALPDSDEFGNPIPRPDNTPVVTKVVQVTPMNPKK